MTKYTYTGIFHKEKNNFQEDFSSSNKIKIFLKFTQCCKRERVIWAKLFDEKTGIEVATYIKIQGVRILSQAKVEL